LLPNTTYQFQIKAVSGNNWEYGGMLNFTTTGGTEEITTKANPPAEEEEEALSSEELRPQPKIKTPANYSSLKGTITISLEVEQAKKIKIYLSRSAWEKPHYLGKMNEKENDQWFYEWDTTNQINDDYSLDVEIKNNYGTYRVSIGEAKINNLIQEGQWEDFTERLEEKAKEEDLATKEIVTDKLKTIEEAVVDQGSDALGGIPFWEEGEEPEEVVEEIKEELEGEIVEEETITRAEEKQKILLSSKETVQSLAEKIKAKEAEIEAGVISQEEQEELDLSASRQEAIELTEAIGRGIKEAIEEAGREAKSETTSAEDVKIIEQVVKTMKDSVAYKAGDIVSNLRRRATVEETQEIETFKNAGSLIEDILVGVDENKLDIALEVAQKSLDGEEIGSDLATQLDDFDQDGLSNAEEVKRGTDPLSVDTDGDSIMDYIEVVSGFDPLNKDDQDIIQVEEPTILTEQKGEKYKVKNVETIVLSEQASEHGLKIKGEAPPLSVVFLYIYSDEPIVISIQADKYGQWSYAYDQPVDDGMHEVYVAVVDNVGKVVESSVPFQFIKKAAAISVLEATAKISTTPSRGEKVGLFSSYALIALITIMIAILVGIVVVGFASKKFK